MAKSTGKMMDCCSNGWAGVVILIGAAYALQHNGLLFNNIILWPWVLIALGVVSLIHAKS